MRVLKGDNIQAPKTCYNFLMLAREGKYNDCPFHRLVPGFMVSLIDALDYLNLILKHFIRYKPVIQQVRAQAESRSGAHHSETNTT